MKRRNKLKINNKMIAVLAVLIAVGFAYITSAVNIGGVFTLFKSTWDIHFDNVQVTSGSVSANPPSFNSNNPELTLAVQFTNPGDFYEFTIDAVNAGDIDGMLDTFTDLGLTEEQLAYLKYTVTYADGEELAKYQELNAGDTCTFKIRIEFRDDIPAEDLPAGGASLSLGFDVSYVRADSNRIRRRAENTLYSVLKDEYDSGGLARKYNGAHQDSMDVSLSTKNIYHWYAYNDTDGTTVTNKNNVIFANHCWQLMRTTDTGGAKLIYNGEVENNQCLDTRGTHVGYNGYDLYKNLNNNYYYGTDYTYDTTNQVFSISGDIEQATWSDSTYEGLIGKYTCMKTTQNETCSELYLVESYNSATYANVITLKSNSHYSQFGTLQFNATDDYVIDVGYMYNTRYTYNAKKRVSETLLSSASLYVSYWYADDIEWNGSVYKLKNAFQISSESDYPSLVGKYTLKQYYDSMGQSFVYYIAAVNGTEMLSIELKDSTNHKLSDYNYIYTYGDSYTDNGDGTYTINNPSTIQRIDWYSNYSNIGPGKYVCKSAVNNTCSELWYTTSSSNKSLTYLNISNTYKYAQGFTWDGSKYILDNDTSVSFSDYSDSDNLASINNHHYTCWNETGECSTLSYIYYNNYQDLYYINLENGKSIDDALDEMLYDDGVNANNSIIKTGLEFWYKHYILNNYDNYIEDTIFCYDRSIIDYEGWNPDGGNINNSLSFKSEDSTYYLSCTNLTDKYSISNIKAQLTYKVGLMTKSELYVIGNRNIRKSGRDYWLGSPSYIQADSGNSVIPDSASYDYSTSPYYDFGVRPAISLSPKTFYTSGDGSMENPYVIYTE